MNNDINNNYILHKNYNKNKFLKRHYEIFI